MGKTIALILAIAYTTILTIVSLISFSDLPQETPKFADKIFHFFAYSLLCLVWFYALKNYFNFKIIKSLVWASIVSVLIGIIIEVLQGSLTLNRYADLKDVFANVFGVVVMVLALRYKYKIEVK